MSEEVPIDNQFESEYKMFVPLTIDDMEVTNTSYFFSGTKVLLLALGVFPYLSFFFVLDIFPSLFSFILVSLLYFFIYSFYVRFVVFEEGKQRETMKDLENNKHSDMSYFWEWDKVGTGKRDQGLVYIQSDGVTLRRGYFVKVDSGSDIGVPEGHYRNFRQAQQDFFRALYRLGMDVKVYNIRKRPELSEALREYSAMLRHLDPIKQEALIKLSQLNIDINFLYSRTAEQRYVTYYLVTNKRIENLRNFRAILDDILDKSLRTNNAFYDPHIMTKVEIDDFLTEYYDLDAVNSSGIHKMNGFKDFNEYVTLVSVVGQDGREVPITLFDELMREGRNYGVTEDVSKLIEKDKKEEAKWEERRKRSLKTKEEALMKERREDRISHQEFEERRKKLQEDHRPENFNEWVEMTEQAREKYLLDKEEREWRERKQAEKHKMKKQRKPKWYEKEDAFKVDKDLRSSTLNKGKPTKKKKKAKVYDDGGIEWGALDAEDDIRLEDLMDD